ncbi:malonyl CoA-acyl carrier protein transacylase [Plasmodium falciparum Santa Lucia]|uniref:Malonyl CoA-acyl carrier protein transacylase n=9 Tax=Plasmodium falciparum TaxID=5833 RepID=W4IY80_PLAFP|nr:malonyl CoA-acyl carrier protein transacylase [Plasmodium falciparum Vietnam Oak-Knoll (FVO)]ETW29690.1 malonyl CoA-acyl carrier protein transacylase [Plasmodium falciparum FCH/4]ETW47811.1 malonyl CoA-acyl carrier protein transacylase [Plasmodium falciparum MaliPS096_E11]ETW54774.1 malonyl CoA-acyl carrier protein transacylase [Plasmodium falciparum Palo Alto/Uganda]ETW59862.1 malonyl CoA-acyl carrier protein transacylase [Plasmodium falciparum CAMP/Malaysia]EUR66810.1 malonyl CoA-acyl car
MQVIFLHSLTFIIFTVLLILILPSYCFIIKDSKIINDTWKYENKENTNKIGSYRKKLRHNVSVNKDIKGNEHIMSSYENEKYIKKLLEDYEKYKITTYSSEYTFFFPGQGEQYMSMGLDTYNNYKECKELYNDASKILGYNLMDMIKNGPIEKLKNSEVAQPSIYTVSMASLEKLKIENNDAYMKLNLCMGYSLGEYAALTCANSLSFDDGVYLTKERGKAMQYCSTLYNMTTVAIVGLTLDNIKKLIEDVNHKMNDDIFIVSYMTDRKFGLCGKPESMDYLNTLAKEKYKAIFTKKLEIAGAFHSFYMFPAKETLKNVLNQITFKKLSVPVISNVDGNAYDDPVIIKDLLILQLTSPIKINTCLQNVLKHGYKSGYELGPGTINTNLLRDISKNTKRAIPYI